MEEQRNGTNNYDLLSDREGLATELVQAIGRHRRAQFDSGMVWRTLVSERTGEMVAFMDRLAAATGSDHSSGSDDVSQPAVEGFDHQLISGVGFRCIRQGETYSWQLESTWDTVDINQITAAEDYESLLQRSNGQRDLTITTAEESNTIWWRIVRDWSRADGNILSRQILWIGNLSYSERLLQLLEDVNTANSIQIFYEHLTLHPDMREQYIARYETNLVAAAYSAVDSSFSVVISHELVATRGGEDGHDGNGLFCAICHENICIGQAAKQLPCSHLFHFGCTIQWFFRDISCPLCRYDFR